MGTSSIARREKGRNRDDSIEQQDGEEPSGRRADAGYRYDYYPAAMGAQLMASVVDGRGLPSLAFEARVE